MEKDPETYAVIGAAMEVHRILGNGFLERVYREATGIELTSRSIGFESEVDLVISYKDRDLDCRYRADIVCFGELLVEVKAVDSIAGCHRSQLINNLHATRYGRGLLINFGASRLQFERFVHSPR